MLDLAADRRSVYRRLIRRLSPAIDFTAGPMLMRAALCVPGQIPRQSKPWRDATATLYDRAVDLRINTWIAAWPRVLGQRPVRIVIMRDSRGCWGDRVYFSTAAKLSAQAILERYAGAWR